jgi:hypothetical protein
LSSNFRPRRRALASVSARAAIAAAAAIVVALAVAMHSDAWAAGTLRKNANQRKTRPAQPAPAASNVVVDDSTQVAMAMIQLVTDAYGGRETWLPLQGVRYDVIYTIPGPEGVPVSTWTESHILWMKERPRARIDNGQDSTIVIVEGDTTWVRRDGMWTSDSTATASERAAALDARWLARMPWSLLGETPRRRVEQAIGRDTALVVRAEYGAGDDRPAGTIARVTFAPPTFGLSTVHWYDPRSKAWFLLELSDEKTRYGWRWAAHRTLYTSDAAGTKGPVVLDARVDDFTVASELPEELLHPPGRPR